MRRRGFAIGFTLVLLLEVALLCCACAHMHCHICSDPDHCALCRCAHLGLRPRLLTSVAAVLLFGVAVCVCRRAHSAAVTASLPLVALKVRLND